MPTTADASRPRRVLMTCDTAGGVWTFSLELARALSAHGIEVALAALGGLPAEDQRRDALRIPGLRLFESTYRLEWMEDPWDDIGRAAEWLMDLSARLRPDLVHLNHYGAGDLPWGVPVVLTAHSCVLSWYEAVRGEPAPAEWDPYRQLVRRAVRSAHVVAAPTRAMLNALVRHYGTPRTSVVIHNARAPKGWYQRPKEPLILAAGRLWDEAKNIAALDRVAPRLPWPVALAGEAQHPTGGVIPLRHARRLGRLGQLDLAHWLARAAIYVLPARYEPFGLSALEAAISGCALVLGDIPSLRELWEGAAVFVPPGDDDALAAAVRGLIRDPDRRVLLADRARRRARMFLPERMAIAYLAAYTDAIGVASTSFNDHREVS